MLLILCGAHFYFYFPKLLLCLVSYIYGANIFLYSYTPNRSPDRHSSNPTLHDHHKSEKRFFVSGLERPPFTTHQTKYTFSVSPSSTLMSKPPPSPGVGGPAGRPITPGSPQIPVRSSSSHDAVRSRTTQRDWSPHGRRQKEDEGAVVAVRPKSPEGLPPGGIPPGNKEVDERLSENHVRQSAEY